MLSRDEEVARELAAEKTDEEIADALKGYQGDAFAWWRVMLSVVTVGALVVMMQSCLEKFKLIEPYVDYTDIDMSLESMLWIGAEIEENREDHARRLWKAEPTNKNYFMNYVIVAGESDELSMDDILEEAEKIDPENSFYDYYAATTHADKYRETVCIKKIKSVADGSGSRKKFGNVNKWEVLDRELYEKALNHIMKAGEKGRVISYHFDVNLDILNGLRAMKENKEMDIVSQMIFSGEYLTKISFHSINMLRVVNILDAKFYELSQNGSEVEVRFWMDEYYKLIDSVIGDNPVLLDLLVAKAIMVSPLGNMKAAAEQAGMTEDVSKIHQLIDQITEDRDRQDADRKVRISAREANEKAYSKGSMVMDLYQIPMLNHALDREKVVLPSAKEGRLAEHAFLGRSLSFITTIILLIALVVMWIFFFAKRKGVRVFSMQSLGALTFYDVVIIMLGGVIFPVVLYLIINKWMALGLSVKEWSVLTVGGALAMIQFLGMVVTVLTLGMALLKWRLCVRLPRLFIRVRCLNWVISALAISAMILVGLSDSKDAELPWIMGGAFLSFTFLSWLVLVGIGAFGKSAELERVTMCRGMLAVYSALVFVFVGLYHYYEAEERHWVSENEEITFKPEHLGVTTVEYNTCQQVRKELEKRLEMIR